MADTIGFGVGLRQRHGIRATFIPYKASTAIWTIGSATATIAHGAAGQDTFGEGQAIERQQSQISERNQRLEVI